MGLSMAGCFALSEVSCVKTLGIDRYTARKGMLRLVLLPCRLFFGTLVAVKLDNRKRGAAGVMIVMRLCR